MKKEALFIYSNRGEYWFHESGNPKNRFLLKEDTLGEKARYFKPNTAVTTLWFSGKIIGVQL
ncbi:MAG: hypothetical protein AAB701_01215, partial [Patescibacteria group bacterium]